MKNMRANNSRLFNPITTNKGAPGLSVRTAVLFLVVILSASASGQTRYVVVSDRLNDVEQAAQASGGVVHQRLKYMKGSVIYVNDRAAAALQARFGRSAIIEPDEPRHLVQYRLAGKPSGGGGSTTAQTIPWGIQAVQARAANVPVSRGAGVLVGVVDTGIQPNHPDLLANVVGGENFVTNRYGVVDPNQWADDHGHGTHVSGTIAALDNNIGVVGVASNAKLFAAKVIDARGNGYVSAVADGIASCVAHGAHVINLSIEGGASEVEYLAVSNAYSAGVILVAAAGNIGLEGATAWPANYPEVLSITAVDSDLRFARFSSWSYPSPRPGREIDFTAPGVGVSSTYLNGGYKSLNGTSMSAAHVSGVVALTISASFTPPYMLYGRDIGLPVEKQGHGLISAIVP